jgi:hypothetical protein
MTAKIKFKKNARIESKKWAKRLQDEYGIEDAGGIHLLTVFADADTGERNAQDIVEREGMVIQDRFGQSKAHPLLNVIRDCRSQKLHALKLLNLDLEPLKDRPGRPEPY